MPETDFKVGELIDNRYLVLSVLGTGGMGILYRVADQVNNGAVIALKTVRLDASSGINLASMESFQQEFQLLTQMHHPNLVDVYSYGVTDQDELYFTMEWVEGQDLKSSLLQLKPSAIASIIIQICRALAYLHARQVIHGDLKPGNVLMVGDQVKLVDFGVALEIQGAEVRSQYYSPGYAAPEVQGKQPVDHRADLYSLGAIWYALLKREPPAFMPGPNVERLIQFTLLEAIENGLQVPKAISSIISRLLATSPKDRYDSANEVITAINEATGSRYALETPETARSYALRSRFVGREAEMQQLRLAWEQALRRGGRLVLISGESGVGKTRLVEEFGVLAQLKGARVAWGYCLEGGGMAYRPWREILRVLSRYVEEKNLAEMKQLGPVLATLLPELWLRPYMAKLAPPANLEPTAAQQRLHNVMVRLFRAAAAQRPTVLVIEDAQWADEATLALLEFLGRVTGPAWLLICVTYREEEVGPDHLLAKLGGSRVGRISLERLTPEMTTELVCSMLGLEELPPFLADRVQQSTEGNAFFVQELVRSLAEDGEVLKRAVTGWQINRTALDQARLPDTIRQVVWQRLERLSTELRQALQCASIVGSVFWDGALGEMCHVPRRQVQGVLQELLTRDLIAEREASTFTGEQEYMFATPAVREVSYEQVSELVRREYHERMAEWLLAHSDEQISEHLGLIADHLEKAGQVDQAVTYLRQAGEQAAAQFANAQALAYFNRALALIPADAKTRRYTLRLACDNVYDLQSARDIQAENLADLAVLAEVLDDDRRRAEVALRQAKHAVMTGDYQSGLTTVQKAIRLAQAADDAKTEAKGYLYWGQALWYQGDYQAAQVQLKQAMFLVREMPEVKAECLRDLGTVSYLQGDYAAARSYYQQSLTLCREIGSRQVESSAINGLGIVAEHQGDFLESEFYHEESLRICREIGFRQGEGNALVDLGNVFLGWGDYPVAKAYYEQALIVYQEIDDRHGEGLVLGNLSLLFHQTGDNRSARDYSRQSLEIARAIGDRSGEGFALTGLGHALLELEQVSQATAAYHEALDVRQELNEENLIMETRAGLARIALAQSHAAEALAQVEVILNYLMRFSPEMSFLADFSNPSLSVTGEALLPVSGHQGLDGTEEPFRIYLTCYRVLQANQDARGPLLLNVAHTLLQEQAIKLKNEALQRSFLENVAAHREIVTEFATEIKEK